MKRFSSCIFIVILLFSMGCLTTIEQPVTQSSVPVSEITSLTVTLDAPSSFATPTLALTSTVVAVPSQQIGVYNFSQLIVYAGLTFPENVKKIFWLSNGEKLGLLIDDTIRLYDVPSFLPNNTYVLPKRQSIYSVAYIKDFGDVLLINQNGNLVLWSLSEDKNIHSYSWENMDLVSAKFSPSSDVIARSGAQAENHQRVIEIMDLNGNVIQKLIGHKNDTPILDFSPDEKVFVASSSGRDLSQNLTFVWDIFSGKLLYSLPDPALDGAIVKFNHIGDKLAVVDRNSLRLWDIDGQKWLGNNWRYEIVKDHIIDITFAPNDDLIIANTSNNTVLFVNAQNGKLLELPVQSKSIVNGWLSPNGRYLAVLYENGQISILGVKDK